MENCGTLIEDPHYSGRRLECIRKDNHKGEHLCYSPPREFSSGVFVEWEFDYECGCIDDDCDCIIYGDIAFREVIKTLQEDYNGPLPSEVKKILGIT